MAEIVNLKRARKVLARVEAEAEAATNRAAHGRTKAEKKLSAAREQRSAKTLDAHKREKE